MSLWSDQDGKDFHWFFRQMIMIFSYCFRDNIFHGLRFTPKVPLSHLKCVQKRRWYFWYKFKIPPRQLVHLLVRRVSLTLTVLNSSAVDEYQKSAIFKFFDSSSTTVLSVPCDNGNHHPSDQYNMSATAWLLCNWNHCCPRNERKPESFVLIATSHQFFVVVPWSRNN